MVKGEGKPRVAVIRRVSPSRASNLMSCPLSEAFRCGDSALRLPTHPKAHFGSLAHNFFATVWKENAGAEAEIKTMWAAHVREYEAALSSNPLESSVLPLSATCEDFEVNSILVVKTAWKMCQPRDAKPSGATAGREVEISSKDGLIAGRLDRVGWNKGATVITDAKTGKPTDAEGNVRQDIIVQLKLYAYLLHDRDGEWPASLRIQPLSGEPVPITFTPAEVEALADEVRKQLASANEAIGRVLAGEVDESELANPSAANCRFCNYRISCGAYWKARRLWLWETAPPDLDGILTSVSEQSGGFFLLGLDTTEGPSVIRGFRLQFLRGGSSRPKIGEPARACEMRRERAPRTFSCRPMTVLWQP